MKLTKKNHLANKKIEHEKEKLVSEYYKNISGATSTYYKWIDDTFSSNIIATQNFNDLIDEVVRSSYVDAFVAKTVYKFIFVSLPTTCLSIWLIILQG